MASLAPALLLTAASAAADKPTGPYDLRTKAAWHNLMALDMAAESADYEDILETLSFVQMEARWRTVRGGRVVLGFTGEHNMHTGPDTEVHWGFRPDKIYVDRPLGPFRFRLGQQVARWGKLESADLVDVLNPRDLRYGPLLPEGSFRVAIPMARVEVGPPAIRGQLYLIPFHVPARMRSIGTDWGVFPNGLFQDVLGSTTSWGGDPMTAAAFAQLMAVAQQRLDDADPSTWWAIDQAMAATGETWRFGEGLETAGRMAWEAPRADGSLMVAYIREDQPNIELASEVVKWSATQEWPSTEEMGAFLNSGDPFLTMDYPRTWMVGLDAATTVRNLGLRAEAVGFSSRGVLTTRFAGATSPELGLGLGLDWMRIPELQLVMEANWRRLTEVNAPLLARDEDEVLTAIFVRLNLFRERLKPELGLLWEPLRDEGMFKPEITWRPRDSLELALGAFVFIAEKDTPRTLDGLMRYQGGPLGLYNDNDAWTMRVTFYL